MKRRITFFIILMFIIEGITGCQASKKEIEKINTDTKKEDEIEINKEVDFEGETADSEQDTQETKTGNMYDNEAKYNQERQEYLETYGFIEETRKEFLGKESDEVSYYYKMERFFVKDSWLNAISVNNTLQLIYDEYEASYLDGKKYHTSKNGVESAYSFWHILDITYAGDDYISLLYNDIYYMGGAHPYSRFNGITIDCTTGEQVSASHFLKKSDEEILAEISNKMGFSDIGSWDNLDFYIEDSSIVFFYRMPGFWEDVVIQREK